MSVSRLLLSYQTPPEIKEGELVEPIGVRRNKNKMYLECRFIAPEQQAAKQILASIEMSNAPKGLFIDMRKEEGGKMCSERNVEGH